MNRLSTIFWMFVIVLGAFGLYLVKYKVQALKDEIAETETKITEERDSLHVIEAEWTYLNRPERLQALAGKYLALKPVAGEQLTELEAVPQPNEKALAGTALANHAVTPVAMMQGGGDGE